MNNIIEYEDEKYKTICRTIRTVSICGAIATVALTANIPVILTVSGVVLVFYLINLIAKG